MVGNHDVSHNIKRKQQTKEVYNQTGHELYRLEYVAARKAAKCVVTNTRNQAQDELNLNEARRSYSGTQTNELRRKGYTAC